MSPIRSEILHQVLKLMRESPPDLSAQLIDLAWRAREEGLSATANDIDGLARIIEGLDADDDNAAE